VPVPVYNRLRTKPSDCDVTVGSVETEPDPLADDHFAEADLQTRTYPRETCVGNDDTE
jgi:hypothetical protein